MSEEEDLESWDIKKKKKKCGVLHQMSSSAPKWVQSEYVFYVF